MTILWATGFEMGEVPLQGTYYSAGTVVSATQKHTGVYSLFANTMARFLVDGSPSDLYVAVWYRQLNAGCAPYVRVHLDSGEYVDLRYDKVANTWDAYVNGGKVADGSVVCNASTWTHLQIHFSIADAGGISSKVDGQADITYSGDTKPSTSAIIDWVELGGNNQNYYDDFIVQTGGWPGDVRFDVCKPNADTATEQWSRSAGADSYALIDEVPPSDADYIYSEANGQQTLVEVEDWDATDKTAVAVVSWLRAWKDPASTQQVKQLLKSGATLDTSAAKDLLTSAGYEYEIYETDPATSAAWTDGGIDGMQIGVESVI